MPGISAPSFSHSSRERIARDWLTPRFGERVGWLAGAHVAAKRYLAATDPDYVTTLSHVSVDSLHHEGGAGIDPAFVNHPWWSDAVRLRRYDDAAKERNGVGASIDEVLVVAERVLDQRFSR
jgi:predicted HD phosphohydrolase